MKENIVIMGAAGRDFHNFNVYFRDNAAYNVVAFTATQIPNIHGRKYPAELAGAQYPEGIPILAEDKLPDIISDEQIDTVVFSYSDVPHIRVMAMASLVNACGANFMLLGTDKTMLKAKVPVISVCAVRTGCGKSQTTRRIADILRKAGKKVVAIRHPMPYGDLAKQAVQRFADYNDLKKHKCTIEEREEYEPHIDRGVVVYAGVDYGKILEQAQQEADIILWDGGNNDTPFYQPDLEIVVADPLRVGDELTYYPGHTNLFRAQAVVINKVDSAAREDVDELRDNIRFTNPDAVIIEAASPLTLEEPGRILSKRVLVIEDGPTLTHGESQTGAGVVAAMKYGAVELVDPRPFAVGTIADTFEKYPDIPALLPAMGYGDQQIKDLEQTINACECDLVVSATPIDLAKLVDINKPMIRVGYELQEIGSPNLEELLKEYTT